MEVNKAADKTNNSLPEEEDSDDCIYNITLLMESNIVCGSNG